MEEDNGRVVVSFDNRKKKTYRRRDLQKLPLFHDDPLVNQPIRVPYLTQDTLDLLIQVHDQPVEQWSAHLFYYGDKLKRTWGDYLQLIMGCYQLRFPDKTISYLFQQVLFFNKQDLDRFYALHFNIPKTREAWKACFKLAGKKRFVLEAHVKSLEWLFYTGTFHESYFSDIPEMDKPQTWYEDREMSLLNIPVALIERFVIPLFSGNDILVALSSLYIHPGLFHVFLRGAQRQGISWANHRMPSTLYPENKLLLMGFLTNRGYRFVDELIRKAEPGPPGTFKQYLQRPEVISPDDQFFQDYLAYLDELGPEISLYRTAALNKRMRLE